MAERGSAFIEFRTVNCIVTGLPAQVHTGHVLATAAGAIDSLQQMRLPTIGVSAGFANDEVMRAAKSDDRGCFGEWKPSDGLKWDSWGFAEKVPS